MVSMLFNRAILASAVLALAGSAAAQFSNTTSSSTSLSSTSSHSSTTDSSITTSSTSITSTGTSTGTSSVSTTSVNSTSSGTSTTSGTSSTSGVVTVSTTSSTSSIRSTTSTSVSPTGTPIIGSIFGSFSYLGCFADASGFAGFTLATTVGPLTINTCLSACAGSKYAGLISNSCYCANTLSNTSSTSHAGTCNTPCPGNPLEICGGSTTTPSARKRLIAPTLLLSIYVQIFPVLPSTSLPSLPSQTLPSGIPAPTSGNIYDTALIFAPIIDVSVNIYNDLVINNFNTLIIGDIYTNIIQVTYISICEDCDFGYDYYTYFSTYTRTFCGCEDDTTKPYVPITTKTVTCQSCVSGGPGTVTVTLPCGATSTSTATWGASTTKEPGQLTTTPSETFSEPKPTFTIVPCSTCPGGMSTSTLSATSSAGLKYTPSAPAVYTGAAVAGNNVGIAFVALVGVAGLAGLL